MNQHRLTLMFPIFRLGICFSLLLTVSASTLAENKQSQVTTEILIEQLNSPQRAERAEAERLLRNRGKSALLAIKQAAELNPDLSFKLREILTHIRSQIAEEALEGTTVEVGEEQSLTLHQAVQSIQEQSGFEIEVSESLRDIAVQIPQQKIPFWKSIDLLGTQGDVGWQIDDEGIRFDPKFQLRYGAAAYPKSLRVAAVHSRVKQSFRTRVKQGLIRIHFRVDVEPHIIAYFLKLRDQDFRLLDEQAEPKVMIPPFNQQSVREITSGSDTGIQFYVDFKSEDALQSEILKLKGKIELLCAAQSTEINLPLNDTSDTDRRVRLMGVERSVDHLKVAAQVEIPKELAKFDSHRISLLHKHVWLTNLQQQKIFPVQKSITKVEGATHNIEFIFYIKDGSARPLEFVYRYPEFISRLNADFEIAELSNAR